MKLIDEVNIDNQRVILRCDFNVPVLLGKIMDDTKIKASLKTINYLIEHNCKVLIMSHFGKVKFETDKEKYSLKIVADHLEKLLNKRVLFSHETRGANLELMVKNLNFGEVLLMENTRYEDIPYRLESSNDAGLADYWSSFGDIFVMDAFASSHRKHASTNGIAKLLPTYIGFLVKDEITNLDRLLKDPAKPFTVIMGGAKVDDKLDLIKSMANLCDHLIITGGLANTCLRTLGFNVGESLVSYNQDIINRLKEILFNYKEKIILPLDVIVGNTYDANFADYKLINEISVDDVISDIGIKTITKIKDIVNESQTIFVNGTVGRFEDLKFCNGTREVLDILKNSHKHVIIGGGDTTNAINSLGYTNAFDYVSSGGGATLEYLATSKMQALDGIAKEL